MSDLIEETLEKPFSSNHKSGSETDQYITFKLAEYLFALPSQAILKIVATPPPNQGGMVSMGLVQLEQYSIQIIDLVTLLNLKGQNLADTIKKTGKAVKSQRVDSTPPQNPPFLMVLQDSNQQLWGIALNEPPDLMDVPHYALKPVPAEKRLTQALRWVSHIVTYDMGGNRHTLLLLDVSILLSSQQGESSSEAPRFPEVLPPAADSKIRVRETEMYM